MIIHISVDAIAGTLYVDLRKMTDTNFKVGWMINLYLSALDVMNERN